MRSGLERDRTWGGRGAAFAVFAVAALSVSACAEIDHRSPFNPPPINPSSPVAPYAEQVAQESFRTPSFASVPPKVTDVRAPAVYKQAVIGEVQQRREVGAWLAQHPPMSDDAEAYAETERKRIPAQDAAAVPTQHDAEAEAFAKRLKEEAQQPPPKQ